MFFSSVPLAPSFSTRFFFASSFSFAVFSFQSVFHAFRPNEPARAMVLAKYLLHLLTLANKCVNMDEILVAHVKYSLIYIHIIPHSNPHVWQLNDISHLLLKWLWVDICDKSNLNRRFFSSLARSYACCYGFLVTIVVVFFSSCLMNFIMSSLQ